MAKLNKTKSGLVFYDDFKEQSLMWSLSPSDSANLFFNEEGLKISHNRRYSTYTMPEPQMEEYSCVINIKHRPFSYEDIAGVIIISSAQEYAECQSYMATGPSELTNSETFKTDIKNMVNNIINDSNYVKYYVNDEEIPKEKPKISEETGRNPGTEIKKPESFVDVYYPWIKFTKMKKKYIFQASSDGYIWIDIGNVIFNNSGTIGFFIYGTDNEDIIKNSDFLVKSLSIYNSKYITIQGIDKNHECEIVDGRKNTIFRTDDIKYKNIINRSNKEILINTFACPCPIKNGKLRIYENGKYDEAIMTFSLGESVYGGDTFNLERNIKLYIKDKELDSMELYDLGDFYGGSYYIKVDVYNAEDYILHNIKIKVIGYSEYYLGEQEIMLSVNPDDSIQPKPELEYHKEIVINEIKPTQGRSFFMKLKEIPIQDFYNTAHSFRFKILVE